MQGYAALLECALPRLSIGPGCDRMKSPLPAIVRMGDIFGLHT